MSNRLLSTLRRASNLVRFRPFDAGTAAGRSHERYRRALLTALGSAGARGATVVTTLVTIPLLVHHLGTERYGLWETIASLLAFLGLVDLGFGSGLVNAVASAHGKNDRDLAATHVSSAIVFLFVWAAILGTIFGGVYLLIPWPKVFNVTSPMAVAEAGPALAIFATFFLLRLPFSVPVAVNAGYQEGYTNGLWTTFGSMVVLVGVILAVRGDASLPVLVAVLSGGPVFAFLLNGVFLFGVHRRFLAPRLRFVRWTSAREVMGVGFYFFILQILGAIAYSADNLIVARVLGPHAVATLAVPTRLFALIPTALTLFLNPLWPAYREAFAQQDAAWARRTLVRSLKLSLTLSLIPGLLLVAVGRPLIQAWVGSQIVVSPYLLAGLAAWSVMLVVGTSLAMFCNGAGLVRFQALVAMVVAPCVVGVKYVMASYAGLTGLVWSGVAVTVVLGFVPLGLRIRAFLSSIQEKPQASG